MAADVERDLSELIPAIVGEGVTLTFSPDDFGPDSQGGFLIQGDFRDRHYRYPFNPRRDQGHLDSVLRRICFKLKGHEPGENIVPFPLPVLEG